MPDPKEQLIDAFSEQGDAASQYAGTDAWEIGEVKAKTRLAQIEYRDPTDATKPNSRFFTDIEEVERLTGPDGKVDMAALSERLQVQVYGGEYNASVSVYEVANDITVPSSTISDNPHFGEGGARQYHFPGDVRTAENGTYVRKIDQIEGTNRTPRLSIFDDLKGLDPENERDKIGDIGAASQALYL